MLIKLDNDIYKIQFFYLEPEKVGLVGKKRITAARLLRQASNDTWDEITTGWARCSDKDNFCKATGKKLALARLFKVLKEQLSGELNLSKGQRMVFWSRYRNGFFGKNKVLDLSEPDLPF
jgi:hypothetical protein